MIEGKPSTFPTSDYNSFTVDQGSHFTATEMMMLEDEEQQDYECFLSIYNKMVKSKSFPPCDNNFDSEEMEHRMCSIFRNHEWDIRFLNNE